jgi:hypothetical protein
MLTERGVMEHPTAEKMRAMFGAESANDGGNA